MYGEDTGFTFPNDIVFLSLKIVFILANSVDPDEMMYYVAFHLQGVCTVGKHTHKPGRVAQLVMCLATDSSLTADPGVTSSIPAMSHTFMEIDHEIISAVILLPSAESFKKGCCQLQAKVCA